MLCFTLSFNRISFMGKQLIFYAFLFKPIQFLLGLLIYFFIVLDYIFLHHSNEQLFFNISYLQYSYRLMFLRLHLLYKYSFLLSRDWTRGVKERKGRRCGAIVAGRAEKWRRPYLAVLDFIVFLLIKKIQSVIPDFQTLKG